MILHVGGALTDISSLTKNTKLLRVVERWLREERDSHKEALKRDPQASSCRAGAKAKTGPLMPSKHLAFYR